MSTTPQRPPADGAGGDPYALWDAAYVLGALGPEERRDFEEHLAGCAPCRTSVAEIAGLPGLLAQVGAEDAARLTEGLEQDRRTDQQETLPPSVLPEVLRHGRRGRRTPLARTLLGLAAAVALVLGGVALGSARPQPDLLRPERLAFTPVEDTSITAVVDVVPDSEGTRLDVECQYGGTVDPDPDGDYARYAVVVVDQSGRSSRVKDWSVKADKVMRPSGHTTLSVAQIRDVEIREAAHDEPVLRASLPRR